MDISHEIEFTSMGVNLVPCKSVEIYFLAWKLPKNSYFHGSTWNFHCQWKWKLPLLQPIAVSTNIFHGSFHELPYPLHTFIYSHEHHKRPATLHKTTPNPNPNSKLALPAWKLAHFQLPWKFPDGSTWKMSWK